jgi:hypothetical protein
LPQENKPIVKEAWLTDSLGRKKLCDTDAARYQLASAGPPTPGSKDAADAVDGILPVHKKRARDTDSDELADSASPKRKFLLGGGKRSRFSYRSAQQDDNFGQKE